MEKLLTRIGLLIAIIAPIFTVYFFFDDHYAKAVDIQQMNQTIQSIQQSITYDHLISERNNKQKRIWDLSDRYNPSTRMPPAVKEEYRQLDQDVTDLNIRLKNIEQLKGK